MYNIMAKLNTAYVRINDLRDVEGPPKFTKKFYYASLAAKTDQGNMGGSYFHKDGTWQGTALEDGHWLSKSVLIARLRKVGHEIVDQTGES